MIKFIVFSGDAAVDENKIQWKNLNKRETITGAEYAKLDELEKKYWVSDIRSIIAAAEEINLDVCRTLPLPPAGSPLEIRYCGRTPKEDEIDMTDARNPYKIKA